MPGRILCMTSTWAALVTPFTYRSRSISSAVLISRHSTMWGCSTLVSASNFSMPSKRAGCVQLPLSVFRPFKR